MSGEADTGVRPDSDGTPRRGLTVYDLDGAGSQSLRQTPRLALDALRIAWRASPKHLLIIVALQFVSGVGVATQLLAAKRVLEHLIAVSQGADVSPLYTSFAVLVVLTGLIGVTATLIAIQQRLLVEFVGRHAFDRIIGVSTTVDLGLLETPDFYDQLLRARNSATGRSITMVTSLTSLVTGVVTSVGIGAVLLFLEPLLLLFVALAAVPLLIATVRNSRESYRFEYAMTPESRERLYLAELLTNRQAAKELRVFGAARLLRARYDELTDERLRRLRSFLRRRVVVALVGSTAGAIGMGIAFGALVVLIANGRIDVATAVTAGVAMQALSTRFSSLVGNVGRLVESAMFIEDYNQFISLTPTHSARPSSRTDATDGVFSGLRVENVTFAYPSRPAQVLRNVDLEIRPDEVVALVGENGSGKSTLVKIICQLYRPDAGRVLWNGVDAASLSPDSIQDQITVLFQDFIQYHLSACDNIALGRPERSPEPAAVVEAAERAGADAFLSALPSGYETRLGLQFTGGNELSVGQWQRLALARAFFRGGDFLVLDEPTASLDPRAEHDLFVQMRRLAQGRSVLLISHRFSSVRSADRIYVLRNGEITETGTHDELMKRGGHYAELFTLQAAAYLGENAS